MTHRSGNAQIDWLRANLFSSWGNAALTLVCLAVRPAPHRIDE